MFCPNCGAEFRPGFTTCNECQVPLTNEPPAARTTSWDAEEDTSTLVTVFRTGDPGTLALAQSLLENAGIQCAVKGDRSQDLFGGGRIGTHFNVVTGPAEILVLQSDVAAAEELLADLDEPPVDGPSDEPPGDDAPRNS